MWVHRGDECVKKYAGAAAAIHISFSFPLKDVERKVGLDASIGGQVSSKNKAERQLGVPLQGTVQVFWGWCSAHVECFLVNIQPPPVSIWFSQLLMSAPWFMSKPVPFVYFVHFCPVVSIDQQKGSGERASWFLTSTWLAHVTVSPPVGASL